MIKQADIQVAKAPQKRLALCYARVSSALQASEGESLDVQRERLQALCTFNGLALQAVYSEEGVSGAKPFTQRPAGTFVEKWRSAAS